MASGDKQRSWPEFYADHRFSVLLTALIIFLIGTPVVMGLDWPVWWLDGSISVLIVAAIFSLCFEPHERIFALAFGIPSALLSSAGTVFSGTEYISLITACRVCEVLFLFGAAIQIVKSLFRPHKLSFDSVFGAVCGYLFLGLGWTGIYLLIEGFQPGSFQINQTIIPADVPNHPLSFELSYYSFVTLTTIGYGDVLPMTPVTRTMSWMEAIAGQFYLAVVVAGLVNSMPSRSTKSPPESIAEQEYDSEK